jgi:hypothetical protein
MISQILQICVTVITVSFTAVIAVGSLCIVSGLIMMLLGKDHD